jgi:hypothetical protein
MARVAQHFPPDAMQRQGKKGCFVSNGKWRTAT